MISRIKRIDSFSKNILVVFAGATVTNIFNLLYQLLLAHRMSPRDFADFNVLLSIFILVISPLATFSIAVSKYVAEFSALGNREAVGLFLNGLLRKCLGGAFFVLFIFAVASSAIKDLLKISSLSSCILLGVTSALSCIGPLFAGAVQGLELFSWVAFSSVATGFVKLILAFCFISMGYGIAGAMGSLCAGAAVSCGISFAPLRKYFGRVKTSDIKFDYRQMFWYLVPLTVSVMCFTQLISFDLILVKYFFSEGQAGIYALAQMVGKIFMFLPGAITIAMFPRTSGQSALKTNTEVTFKRSLLYTVFLCFSAVIFYNLFPGFVLKILTGKVSPETIYLGRFFSFSMTMFALLNVFIMYFLSVKDFRFIAWIVIGTIGQFCGIIFFHASLAQVQIVLGANALLLVGVCALLFKARVKFKAVAV